MTTITPEPTPPIRIILIPFAILCGAVYLLFTALVLQIYVLVPIAVALFAIATVPALRLLKRK